MFSDFIFDKEASDFHGVRCVSFNSRSGAESISAGCETDLVVEKAGRGNKFYITKHEYSSPMTFNFQIINYDGSTITPEKESSLKKWLCKRNGYKRFQLEDERYSGVEYEVIIYNPKIIDIGDVKGMEFTISTNSPFGYSPILNKAYNITNTNKTIGFYVNTDEDDYIYPTVTLTMAQAGNLNIINSTEVANRIFTLNNVAIGEVITINNELPHISSSTSHDVYKDFNKNWIRLVDGKNTLTFNLNCTVKLEYKEVRKVGVY